MSSVQFTLEDEESILPKLDAINLGVETPNLEGTDTIETILLVLLCLTLLSCFFKRICAQPKEKKRE